MASVAEPTEPKHESEALLRHLADLLRSARLNQLYYGSQLERWRRWSRHLDGFLAVGTSGAVGSFAIWSTAPGALLWQLVVGAVAVLTVLKPLFELPKKIERYSSLFGRYSDLYYELKALHADVRLARGFDATARKVLDRAESRYRTFGPEDDPSYPTEKVAPLEDRVNKELPPEHLWIHFEN